MKTITDKPRFGRAMQPQSQCLNLIGFDEPQPAAGEHSTDPSAAFVGSS